MINTAYLRESYPPFITAEQVRVILHISKRKAAWMLNNGYIKCKATQKKTRKYTIKLDDLIEYIEDSTLHPEHYHMPDSMFSSSASKVANKYGFPKVLPTEDFRLWLSDEWADLPDSLTNTEVTDITGYGIKTVNRWLANKWLRSVKIIDGVVTTREWLIDYYSGSGYNIGHMNPKHVALMRKYFNAE